MQQSSDDSPASWRAGMTLGNKYRLVRELGRGAVGVVFEATNLWTSRRVAVKILLPEHAADLELAHRFIGEARAAARIQHPNIVDVLDLDRSIEDGSLYLVLEYVEGGDLRALLQRRGTLEVEPAIDMLLPVLDALDAAHAQGIVHRDIKPENILLAKHHGVVLPKLIDFGISKFLRESGSSRSPTAIGAVMGTPQYMSPEQAAGLPTVDHRTDVWAMGVILLELLTGRSLIDADNPMEVLSRLIYSNIPLDAKLEGLPPPVAAVISTALQRDIHSRFESATAMRSALCSLRVAQAPPRRTSPSVTERGPEMFEFSDEEESTVQSRAPARGRFVVLDRAREAASAGDFEHALRCCDEARAAGLSSSAERVAECELRVMALRWLGRFDATARVAAELNEIPEAPATARLRALWLLGWSGVWLADQTLVRRACALFRTLDDGHDDAGDRAFTALRLGAYLAAMGLRQDAEALLATAQRQLDDALISQSRIRAAIAEARAALASAGGDPELQIERLAEAESCFTEAGDAREATLMRLARADAMREIGAANEALAVIAARRAQPSDASPVAEHWEQLIALSCAAAMAEPSAARAFQSRLEEFRAHAVGQHRNVASVQLAQLYLQSGLVREAAMVVEDLLSTPNARASDTIAANAIRAHLHLRNDDPETAVAIARKAYGLLMQSQTYLASEAAIRLAYAKALVADNQMHLGWGMLVEARQRLVAIAMRLSRPELRQSYLRAVSSNAEIVRLGKRWLDVDVDVLNTAGEARERAPRKSPSDT